MATITRSITLDDCDIFQAVAEWIAKHHPEQEMDRENLHVIENPKGSDRKLSFTATWTVTKPVPEKKAP